MLKLSTKKTTKQLDSLSEYNDVPIVENIVPKTEIPDQVEFFKLPKKFGHIPVDVAPKGYDKDDEYNKLFPVVQLPIQKVGRVSFGYPEESSNELIWGDNLHILRNTKSNSVDLIYIDPPFFSGADYNVIFGDQNETRSFSDIWEGGMDGYLIWLNARLLEMKRVLKNTGSIYVHLDHHAVHYVKKEMDKIFGYKNFRREIIWSLGTVSGYKSKTNNWIRGHDSILYYTKSEKFNFNKLARAYSEKYKKRFRKIDSDGRRYRDDRSSHVKQYLDEAKGKFFSDVWDDIMSFQQDSASKEIVGYPTQKPEALLERIIEASSKEGDVVADFFVGGGTTPVVAQKLGRRWIACDQSRVAVAITQGRLETLYDKTKQSEQQSITTTPDISIQYWGNYELPSLAKMSEEKFKKFIVKAYGGIITSTSNFIHGFKSQKPLFVGSPKSHNRVTKKDVLNFGKEMVEIQDKYRGIMLSWSFADSAKTAVEYLQNIDGKEIDLIKIKLLKINSSEFKQHVTNIHNDYSHFLTFIMPPIVKVKVTRTGTLKYKFDASESMALNLGSIIINVQWDLDYAGRFKPTKGYVFRKSDEKSLIKINYQFKKTGQINVACRIQDDVGGEKIHVETVEVN